MILDKELQKIIEFEPHEGQQKLLESNARDITICAGRRWGKSAVCAYLILRTFLQAWEENRESIKVWIVAPNYELTQKVFEYLMRWMMKVSIFQTGKNEIAKFISNRPYPQIKISESKWIQCKSAENPDSLLGEELDLVIIDEAARIPKNIYENYIYPTTSKRKGRTVFISTPFGQNWFYHKWVECKNSEDGLALQFRTKDNPYFPNEEWERAKMKLPSQVFAQEYEASFLPDAAAVFRGIDEIIKSNTESDVISGHRYVMGVDIAKHEDFTVLTVVDKYNNNVVYWDRFKDIEYPFQKARIKAVAQRYNNARIIVDSTGVGEPIQEDLAREGLFVDDFKFTNQSKKELVEKGSIFIEQKNIFIPPKEVLIDELKSFGYRLTDSGNVIYSAPQGIHDDAVISLLLTIWGLTGRANPKTAIQVELAKTRKFKKRENFI